MLHGSAPNSWLDMCSGGEHLNLGRHPPQLCRSRQRGDRELNRQKRANGTPMVMTALASILTMGGKASNSNPPRQDLSGARVPHGFRLSFFRRVFKLTADKRHGSLLVFSIGFFIRHPNIS